MWHPITGERLFQVTFDASERIDQNSSKPVHASDKEKPKTKKDLTYRQISCICYSQKYHLYFCCMKNFNMIVFNEYLNTIAEIPLKIRLVTECVFIDDTKSLICAGLSGCYMVQMKIEYGYDPRQAVLLDPKGNSIDVSVLPFDPVFNEEQQEQIRVWLENHRKDENSERMYLDIQTKEKVANMDKLLKIVGDKGSDYPEYLKFLKVATPSPEL